MTWMPELENVELMRKLGKRMGGIEGIERQHSQGRLTVRERISLLLDKGSFQEVGTTTGVSRWDDDGNLASYRPGSTVRGYGLIEGRPVILEGQDFTIRGGAADGAVGAGRGRDLISMAGDLKLPLVRLLDSAGGSVRNYDTENRPGGAPSIVHHGVETLAELPVNVFDSGVPGTHELPRDFDVSGFAAYAKNPLLDSLPGQSLLAQVPVISAVLGSVAGGPAVQVGNCHFSVMTKNSETFVGGPPMVKQALGVEMTKQELGNYRVQAEASGSVHNVAEDEEDAFRQIRRFLSYLPSNVWQLPPRQKPTDDPNRRDEELLSFIPRSRRVTYDIRKLIRLVMDADSTFEISGLYGRALVTMLARIDGFPVAVIANDCRRDGGAMTASACIKLERFVDFADVFHLPVVYFCDVPGFMVGLESEKAGIIRFANRAMAAVREATIPYITIVIRRLYGVAGGIAKGNGMGVRYAWPSAESGSLVAEGGVMAAFRREIEAAPDPEAKQKELEERFIRMASVLRQPGIASPMEIIDPRNTRPAIIDYIRKTYPNNMTQLGPKIRYGMRP
jgi:acetyl-CoA carboxylase carboxyltransferase component